ncbi:MAG: UDP-glucose/GDP-mannose dehydrogenase family protein [Thermoleophilia bacterium]|nr:UDP-glucose/GDP-mannose dehydrogenase family protein [Thermoleophilia bacterium]
MSHQPVIGVIGVGYVGLVSAACFAELGNTVVCRDIIPEKVERLKAGHVPFYEPGLSDLVVRNRSRLTFTTDLHEVTERADLIFICVNTPSMYSGDADLSYVESVIAELPDDLKDVVLVMKSTVPVGTGDRLRKSLDDRGLAHVRYVSNPEFLKEGAAIDDFMHPDRVVIGSDDESAIDLLEALHRPLETNIVRTDIATAEMIKYASNAFLATKISFINEIANVCEETGADVSVVAEGMGYDPRIGRSFLRAGIGFGGSCFPKDVAALKQLAGNSGYHFQLLNAVIEVNELQKRRLIGKLQKHLGTLRGKRIALLGLAFKPGTDDMRDAASLVLSSRLLAEGADVVGHDPIANVAARALLHGVEIVDDVMDAVTGADAVVLVTEWPEYAELDLTIVAEVLRTKVLIDGRNLYTASQAAQAGLTYECIGRPGAVVGTPARRESDRSDSESSLRESDRLETDRS